MRRTALTVFILFFGLAFVDALTDGRWPRVFFWLTMAAIFGFLEWWGHHRRPPHGGAT